MNNTEFKPKGFRVDETYEIKNVAYLSLGIAIESYLSTYQDMDMELPFLDDKKMSKSHKKHNGNYIKHACEAITHFQHFAELFIKDILNEIHPLLAIDTVNKHVLLYELLQGNVPTPESMENSKQIEFSLALDRITELIKHNHIDSKYKFIFDANQWLKEVNTLRNRISHRGIFVLNYFSLDELFGRYIFPFIDNALTVSSSVDKNIFFKTCASGLTPIREIINYFARTPFTYNVKDVALLKELGRATYHVRLLNLPYMDCFDEDTKGKAVAEADDRVRRECGSAETMECPVCGVNSLVLFTDRDYEEDANGNVLSSYDYVHETKCYCCSFSITNHLDGANVVGFDLSKYLWSKVIRY